MTSEWMSAGEAAQAYGVSPDTIYRALKAGTLPVPAVKVGRQWRIHRESVERFVATFSPAGTRELLDRDDGPR